MTDGFFVSPVRSDTPRPLARRRSVALLFRMNVCTSVSIIATADATSLISCTSLLGLYLTLRLPSTCFALLPFHIPCLLAITKGSYCSHQHDNIMVYITRSAVYMQILHEFQAQVIPGNRSASLCNGQAYVAGPAEHALSHLPGMQNHRRTQVLLRPMRNTVLWFLQLPQASQMHEER